MFSSSNGASMVRVAELVGSFSLHANFTIPIVVDGVEVSGRLSCGPWEESVWFGAHDDVRRELVLFNRSKPTKMSLSSFPPPVLLVPALALFSASTAEVVGAEARGALAGSSRAAVDRTATIELSGTAFMARLMAARERPQRQQDNTSHGRVINGPQSVVTARCTVGVGRQSEEYIDLRG